MANISTRVPVFVQVICHKSGISEFVDNLNSSTWWEPFTKFVVTEKLSKIKQIIVANFGVCFDAMKAMTKRSSLDKLLNFALQKNHFDLFCCRETFSFSRRPLVRLSKTMGES